MPGAGAAVRAGFRGAVFRMFWKPGFWGLGDLGRPGGLGLGAFGRACLLDRCLLPPNRRSARKWPVLCRVLGKCRIYPSGSGRTSARSCRRLRPPSRPLPVSPDRRSARKWAALKKFHIYPSGSGRTSALSRCWLRSEFDLRIAGLRMTWAMPW